MLTENKDHLDSMQDYHRKQANFHLAHMVGYSKTPEDPFSKKMIDHHKKMAQNHFDSISHLDHLKKEIPDAPKKTEKLLPHLGRYPKGHPRAGQIYKKPLLALPHPSAFKKEVPTSLLAHLKGAGQDSFKTLHKEVPVSLTTHLKSAGPDNFRAPEKKVPTSLTAHLKTAGPEPEAYKTSFLQKIKDKIKKFKKPREVQIPRGHEDDEFAAIHHLSFGRYKPHPDDEFSAIKHLASRRYRPD